MRGSTDKRVMVEAPPLAKDPMSAASPPTMTAEVTVLSDKLIHAINHQTVLDDKLGETKRQLDVAQQRVQQLETSERSYISAIDEGDLMRRDEVEAAMLELRRNITEEQNRRRAAEEKKRATDQELESLTAALFEEANQMVVKAKQDGCRDLEAAERRNEHLQSQLRDAGNLLASHQEQLAELKRSMQEMRSDDVPDPTSPTFTKDEAFRQLSDAMLNDYDGLSPTSPTNLTQLIAPVLRHDVHAFEDFHNLFAASRRTAAHSRMGSGSHTALNGLVKAHHSLVASTANASTPSLLASNPSTPSLAHTEDPMAAPTVPLKETAFYKRALIEDIEPTLRLETAPGLSWLARRSVISSMCDGRLIVQPIQPSDKNPTAPCALCDQAGPELSHTRTHRFKVNEAGNGQSYPLCEYCLGRIRTTCNFLSFLRMVKDGVWRADDTRAEESAWEEAVRLRERMFWARIGGGVVLASQRSPRTSVEPPNGHDLDGQSKDPAPASASAPEAPDDKTLRAFSSLSTMSGDKKKSPIVRQKALPEPPEFASVTASIRPQMLRIERARSPSNQSDASLSPLTMSLSRKNSAAYARSPSPGDQPQAESAKPSLVELRKASLPFSDRDENVSARPQKLSSSPRNVSSITRRAALFESSAAPSPPTIRSPEGLA